MMEPLPPAVLRLWRASAVLIGVVIAVLAGAVATVAREGSGEELPVVEALGIPGPLLAILLGLVVAGVGWAIAGVRYRAWRYELTDEWIQARWGVLYRHTATIPRNRVQTVTSENGPIDRLLDLTSVTVHTAGAGAPDLVIPHLGQTEVDHLRDQLGRGRPA